MTSKLTVTLRDLTGRKVKQLRRQGIIPANIFGQGKDSRAIQVSQEELIPVYQEAGQTSVIALTTTDGNSQPVVISEVQIHPITGDIIHVDFLRVDLDQAITAYVPVEFVGESLAVKDGALMVTLITEFEVEALPNDMPHAIEVDISPLTEVGMQLTLADIDTSSKFTINADPDTAIVKVEAPRAEETFDDEASTEIAETETETAEATDTEQETPAE